MAQMDTLHLMKGIIDSGQVVQVRGCNLWASDDGRYIYCRKYGQWAIKNTLKELKAQLKDLTDGAQVVFQVVPHCWS